MTTVTDAATGGGNTDERIGFVVHMLMYRARITQKSLAEHLGIQQSAVSRKLRGARPWLASELVVVARALGVSPADLLPGDDGPTDLPPPLAPLAPAPQSESEDSTISGSNSGENVGRVIEGPWSASSAPMHRERSA